MAISTALSLIGWGLAALRHYLLQSNAYDLGLFDQWSWLMGTGSNPVSSMEHVHVLGDHGAWVFSLAGFLYSIHPSVQWLLASQAFVLAFTAISVWMLATQAKLSSKQRWFCCLIWWMQPLVFNVNLFDFHPEVWAMPLLGLAIWCQRQQRWWTWITLLILILGCRDGLVLITLGLALSLALEQRWRWAVAAASLSTGWLLLLNQWLYPWLRGGQGPKAAAQMFAHLGDNLNEILLTLLTRPWMALSNIDWVGSGFYLFILMAPLAVFWRRRSLTILSAGVPLVLVNLNAEASSYRTLIHHYSLPLAVLMVVATIDGLSQQPTRFKHYRIALVWLVAWWVALAKPGFFSGPYLARVQQLNDAHTAISMVKPDDRVLTTSYLVPHLSHRHHVAFPKSDSQGEIPAPWNLLLLNPKDPGWGSKANIQKQLLATAQDNQWHCQSWPSALQLCRQPAAKQPDLGRNNVVDNPPS